MAVADPLADAQKQLDTLEEQRSAAEESYNESQQRLADAQKQRTQLTTDIADQQAKIDALKPTIVWIVTMERQSSGIDMTASFLLNDSPDAFLNQVSTEASVTSLIDEQVARYTSEQQRLDDLNGTLDATVKSIQDETDQQKQLLDTAKAKEDAAEGVVNRLTAQQRAALAARQQATDDASAPAASSTSKGHSSATPSVTGSASSAGKAAAAWALKQVGKRYVYGAAGPNAFDCSGLTMMAYRQVGISLPHGARSQSRYGKPVSRSNLQPGDLVFFYTPISHVGIYIGGGKIVHAGSPRTGVQVASVFSSFNTARRIA
jgi:cell wall-associated NlpC family hydrolase